jgi:LEA14-like dessication related protein
MVVENPTSRTVKAESFDGKLDLEQHGEITYIGKVSFSDSFSVPSKGSQTIPIVLRYGYQEIKNSWRPVGNAIGSLGPPVTWSIEGDLVVSIAGSKYSVPVKMSRSFRESTGSGGTSSGNRLP